jgi:hypothetical protein
MSVTLPGGNQYKLLQIGLLHTPGTFTAEFPVFPYGAFLPGRVVSMRRLFMPSLNFILAANAAGGCYSAEKFSFRIRGVFLY